MDGKPQNHENKNTFHHPDYQPALSMLAGESYVLEYQQNIMNQLKTIQGFRDFSYEAVIKGHVGIWILTKK